MLHVQKLIKRKGPDKALSHLANKLGISIKTADDGRVLFKYSMIDSPMASPYVQECRGLILDRFNDWAIVSFPFTKFFNYGESHAADIDMATARIQEKVDGCLDGDSILQTTDGKKTIREICETKYEGKVLSFDIDSGESVLDEIVNHSILDDEKDWYEIETEDGNIIKLTGNHKVWLPKLSCYRRVDKLNGDEIILMDY